MREDVGAKRKITVRAPKDYIQMPRVAPVIFSPTHRIGKGGAPVYQSKVYPSRNWGQLAIAI